MSVSRRSLALFLLLCATIGGGVHAPGAALAAPRAHDAHAHSSGITPHAVAPAAPSNVLRVAWERARGASSYRFDARIDEQLTPLSGVQGGGRTGQHVILLAGGAARLPDQSRVTLQMAIGARVGAPLILIRSGANTFLQRAGHLSRISGGVGLANSDFLGYLAGATGVRVLGPARIGTAPVTRYTFRVDGGQLNRSLADNPLGRSSLPAGTATGAALSSVSGTGELWVDARGMPARMRLSLAFPRASKAYAAQLDLGVDFTQFGQVGPLPRPVQGFRW